MSQGMPTNLGNGHIETLLPYLLRPVKQQDYQRQRIDTPDGDFLDLDWVKRGQKKLLIISHGLESSSRAQYVQGMADLFKQNGFDVLAWNYRSCSGEMNRTARYYHSGASDDLDVVVAHALKNNDYDSVSLIGFSLGGNLTLKYAGEKAEGLDPRIQSICVFSTPCYLKTASHQLATGFNRIYTQTFVKSLRQKVVDKHALLSRQGFDLSRLNELRTLPDFDDQFTGPLHGFKDSDDYYEQCSSRYFIKDIKRPTLIVNAANDPFLSKECYPYDEVAASQTVSLEVPKYGGHVGFFKFGMGNVMWSEARALSFIRTA
ncbi:YheT family hydrolase [Leucothrix pacifica]|uniref:Alpha/beta hydrolase n=1 Tax=Leucothrix pacifica TaxID=1247513 RepID=A0A317CGW5_9GAMM|nr:alpha/beta fold hydrolase [Leucothrix pacifica]PWQ97824.1 alpha/beta hydrolase [Leucothrix pacifica]